MSRRIYLDDAMHGEVKASSACNRNGYQYCLTGITAGQSRDIYVKVKGHAMFSILFRKPPIPRNEAYDSRKCYHCQ